MPSVPNFAHVDGHLWRGAAPSLEGHRRLAGLGVHTVIDLRAERLSPADSNRPAQAGLKVVHIPIRDGQAPTATEVDRFISIVKSEPGTVFVVGTGPGARRRAGRRPATPRRRGRVRACRVPK